MSAPVPIGTRMGPVYYALWAALSALFAFLAFRLLERWLAGSTIALNPLVWMALFVIGLAWIAAMTWRYLPGRGWIDLEARTLRSGRRVVRVDELTQVYRIPGGPQEGEFGLRFRIERGRDLRLQVSSRSFTDVTLAQVDAVIALVSQAPIVIDPRRTPRPPVRNELGERSVQQQIDDTTGELVMLYEETSYSKAVLLEELTVARETLAQGGSFPWAAGADGNSKVAAILLSQPIHRAHAGVILPSSKSVAVVGEPTVDYARGFFGTMSKKYRTERAAVEAWLRGVNPTSDVPTFGRLTGLGWALIALMIVWPVIAMAAFAVVLYWAPGGLSTPSPIFGVLFFVSFVFILSPIIIWAASVLIWYARIRRHRALRKAVLAERGRGVIPLEIRNFFGSPHPDGYIEQSLLYLWAAAWCLAIAGGVTSVIVGFATWDVYGPVASVFTIVLGAAFALASFPWFGVGVRRIGRRTVTSTVGELEYRLMGEEALARTGE